MFPNQGKAEGNIEVSEKQNSLVPKGPVIKCLLLTGCRDDFVYTLAELTILSSYQKPACPIEKS